MFQENIWNGNKAILFINFSFDFVEFVLEFDFFTLKLITFPFCVHHSLVFGINRRQKLHDAIELNKLEPKFVFTLFEIFHPN